MQYKKRIYSIDKVCEPGSIYLTTNKVKNEEKHENKEEIDSACLSKNLVNKWEKKGLSLNKYPIVSI